MPTAPRHFWNEAAPMDRNLGRSKWLMRLALRNARSALTHADKLEALRSASQARRGALVALGLQRPVVSDLLAGPVIHANGSPAAALRPPSPVMASFREACRRGYQPADIALAGRSVGRAA